MKWNECTRCGVIDKRRLEVDEVKHWQQLKRKDCTARFDPANTRLAPSNWSLVYGRQQPLPQSSINAESGITFGVFGDRLLQTLTTLLMSVLHFRAVIHHQHAFCITLFLHLTTKNCIDAAAVRLT